METSVWGGGAKISARKVPQGRNVWHFGRKTHQNGKQETGAKPVARRENGSVFGGIPRSEGFLARKVQLWKLPFLDSFWTVFEQFLDSF